MKRIRRSLARLAELSGADRRLLVEALWWFTLARLTVLVVPFRRLSTNLRSRKPVVGPDRVDDDLLDQVAWAVASAANRTAAKNSCLPRAIAAKKMLHRRGVGSSLSLGVMRGEGGALEAHAWLRVGGRTVTGGEDDDGRYTTVTIISDEKR